MKWIEVIERKGLKDNHGKNKVYLQTLALKTWLVQKLSHVGLQLESNV